MHEGCRYYAMPKTHSEFWLKKMNRNRERDVEVQHQLARLGWHCITVWECQLKPDCREATLESLALTLNKIFLDDRRLPVKKYAAAEEEEAAELLLAAEDSLEEL